MLSLSTLRNIYKKDIYEQLLRRHNVPNRSVRIQQATEGDRYSPIQRILNEELNSGLLSEQIVDDFLFNQLFYAINNWHYVYVNHDINQRLISNTTEEILTFLQNINELNFNRPLTYTIGQGNYNVCTTRVEIIDESLKKINILIKVGTAEEQDQYIHFFSGITIDLESNLVIIRFNQHLLDLYEEDIMDVLNNIKDMLNGANRYGDPFEPLEFNVIGLNEEKPKQIISELFKEVSNEAELILNREVPQNTEADIREFLVGKGLPCEEDYIQQIKSVIFQDIASKCEETLFPNGWVFRFVFREGQYTRASSRTDDKSPIYSSKVYWHLKELIFNSEDMQESGFHWYLDDPTETEEPRFVQVRLESRLDTLIIHYYYKMRTHDRKEKEDYVLRKISEYL
ncbi:hypothetical protein CHH83_05815 [Bacillus sp. 7586-K]|nr:hypothetical protein CHH83_05815 [Bacillus sp. 7586-K]